MTSKLLIYTITLAALALVAAPDRSWAQASKTPPKVETEAWQKAKAANTFEAAVGFVKKFPKSDFVKEARVMFPRPGKSNYEPKSMTAALYLENGDMYAIAEVGGNGHKSGPMEEGLSMLQTKEERDVWYEIVSSDRVGEADGTGTVIRVVTANLHVYLISNLSFNFTGKIKPL